MTAIEHLTKVLKSLDNRERASLSGNTDFVSMTIDQLTESVKEAKVYLEARAKNAAKSEPKQSKSVQEPVKDNGGN